MTDLNRALGAAADLVAAIAAMPTITKGHTANTGTYSYTYADLADVLAAVRPVLAANNYALVQSATTDGNKVGITTLLIHSSGVRHEFGPLTMPAGSTPQSAGSALSYARRYSIAAALGLAFDADDDGAAAGKSIANPPPPEPVADEYDDLYAGLKFATTEQKAELSKLRDETGRKLTADDFRAHPDWAARVREELDT